MVRKIEKITDKALSLYSQSEGKTKEEILDGLNITTPLNELEGQEIYTREEVLAAMEACVQQFQSKENEGKQAGVEDAAKEYCSAIWLDHSAKFNGLSPSHVQRTIKDFIAGAKWASGERGEVERLKGLLRKEVEQTGGSWINYSKINSL